MPTYIEKIEHLLYEEDVRKIYDAASSNDERVMISLLWLTGARPAELMRSKATVERKSITANCFRIEPDSLSITLNTLKRGTTKDFQVKQRTLVFARAAEKNTYVETIVNHIHALSPEGEVLPYTTRWGEKVISRLSKQTLDLSLSPYHFRHSVMTWLMQNGKSALEVQYFKGAASLSGVRPYLHAKPMVVNMVDIRRSRVAPPTNTG